MKFCYLKTGSVSTICTQLWLFCVEHKARPQNVRMRDVGTWKQGYGSWGFTPDTARKQGYLGHLPSGGGVDYHHILSSNPSVL